jgi:hypothetical protein
MVVFDPLAVLLLIAANMSLKEKENGKLEDDVPLEEVVREEEKIQVDKENITTMAERSVPETQTIVKHLAPGLYSEEPAPVKNLEPKYDYEAELAFREKESK